MTIDDRTYIRVHDGLDEHPKVEPLSDAAFRLLMTSWFYCSRNKTDGRILNTIWKRRGTAKTRAELIAAGLVEAHDGHVEMHDYLLHQRSAQEIDLLRSVRGDSGSYGNHVRWHVVKRKPKKDCEHCKSEPRNDRKPVANAIANGSQTDRKPIASTEAEAEAEELSTFGGVSHVSSHAATQPPLDIPSRCADHQYDVTPPKCGACADARVFDKANRERLAAAPEMLPDYRVLSIPDLCGNCDDRWIETPTGLARCPECGPKQMRKSA